MVKRRCPLRHVLVGRVRKDILNPARKTRLNIGESLLVNVDIAGNTQFVVYIFAFHGRRRDANLLQALRRQLHGRQGRLGIWRGAGAERGCECRLGPRATTGSCDAAVGAVIAARVHRQALRQAGCRGGDGAKAI